MRTLFSRFIGPHASYRSTLLVVFLALAMLIWLTAPLGQAFAAAVEPLAPAGASCAELARMDRTATNGSYWGVTLLPGHGAPGGWFGVPVCANSVNHSAPGGANVSCDRAPFNFWATGCAPGSPTSDGYGWSFQCVELVVRFSAWAFGAPPSGWRGDAPYLWLNANHPSSFEQRPDGGAQPPVPGDVLVWGTLDHEGRPWPAGPAGGHVAVVAATGDGWITFVEQNMLTRKGDIPEETTTLTKHNGRWTVGHTYALSGGRALYGWLHEKTNNGYAGGVTGTGAASVTRATSAPAHAAPPAAPPTLAQGVVVTGAGSLAQLVWSDSHTPATTARGNAPHAVAESLGAPPGTTLAAAQQPAVVTLPGDARYIFALGNDARLYGAYTSGQTGAFPGPLWQSLGAPAGVRLSGSVAAIWDGATLTVAATGSDGELWARSGPAGMLDGWVSFGQPTSAKTGGSLALVDSPALIRQPAAPAATHATNAAWLALAVGADGALYELDSPSRITALAGASGETGAARWTQVLIAGQTAPLNGAVIATAESGTAAGHASAMGSVDTLVADTAGRLWLLRRTAMSAPWQARSVSLPDPDAELLGATLSLGANAAPALNVYIEDPQVSASASEDQITGQTGETLAAFGALTSAITLDGSGTASWSVVGYRLNPGSGVQIANSGQPVALPGFAPALVLSTATQVYLAGDQAALDLLAPGARATPAAAPLDAGPPGASTIPASPAIVPGAGSVAVGSAVAPVSFADQFAGASLNPRWTLSGAPPASVTVSNGLILTAPASGAVEADQGAPVSDATLAILVTPGAQWPAGAQAGVRLALDDWNALTLAINAGGKVTLCPVVAGAALACQTASFVSPDPSEGVYLRLTVQGSTVTADVSLDGGQWSRVGVWSVVWAPGAPSSKRGAYAPPLASGAATTTQGDYAGTPLLFTRLGFFVAGGSAQFSRMAMTAAG